MSVFMGDVGDGDGDDDDNDDDDGNCHSTFYICSTKHTHTPTRTYAHTMDVYCLRNQ